MIINCILYDMVYKYNIRDIAGFNIVRDIKDMDIQRTVDTFKESTCIR